MEVVGQAGPEHFQQHLGQTPQTKLPQSQFFFYPSIGEYATVLERHRLEVREARLFDRPTPVEDENGMENWLQMFCGRYFEGLSTERTKEKIREMVAILRPRLYRDGVWTVDYRRLRVVAVKT